MINFKFKCQVMTQRVLHKLPLEVIIVWTALIIAPLTFAIGA